MRKPIIAGNWKMYKTPTESIAFLDAFLPLVANHTRDEIRLFPSITSLPTVLDSIAGTTVHAGAQTMHWLNEGPYTGETSPTMLLALGCKHVLLGHSEQRLYFGETSERVNLKLKAAISHGIAPIVCGGEHLSEREENRTEEVLRTQLRTALHNVSAAEAQHLVIAYEPVWAIGTGKTATTKQAQEAHAFIRSLLVKIFDKDTARRVRIQYGGSVKPNNAKELMGQPDVDGALVGGASLEARSFADIIKNSI